MGDVLSPPDSTRDGRFPDPTRRHALRRFADEVWTDDVRDGAIDSADPLGLIVGAVFWSRQTAAVAFCSLLAGAIALRASLLGRD